MLIVGDVHGKVNDYWKLIQKHNPDQSIQIGDFGFKKHHEWFLSTMDCNKHKVLFGNHDDYNYVNEKHSLGDWQYFPDRKLFTIRGAHSIDRRYRVEGVDWWKEEEIPYMAWREIMDEFERLKPEIVLTHDCPQSVRQQLFNINEGSLTSNALQFCFTTHQPQLWVFGHHHKSVNEQINGTRFICLPELGTMTI